MNILSEKDYLQVNAVSLLADYDRDTIANLYQPIIGYAAMALYYTLWAEASNQKTSSIVVHKTLFKKMGITVGDFVDARKVLEATSLIRTFVTSSSGITIYLYELFAPKTPKEFFNHTLFYGMLLKNIGEKEAKRLKQRYIVDKLDNLGQEISSTFSEVYQPDFNDPIYQKALETVDGIVDRKNGKMNLEFSFEKFFVSLGKISGLTNKDFTSRDMKEIERITSLYGVNEDIAADQIIKFYNDKAYKGKRIDFTSFSKACAEQSIFNPLIGGKRHSTKGMISSDSEIANKINLMEEISPKEYLRLLQNMSDPVAADLKLLSDISNNFHFSNGVINAAIDFTLEQNHNVLSRRYCEKICASLAREGVSDAYEAMCYLHERKENDYKNERKGVKKVSKREINDDIGNTSDTSWNDILNQFGDNDDEKN